MGTDIHCHIEVMHNREWHHYSNPRVPRDYTMFSKMCGVRDDNEEYTPIVKPITSDVYMFMLSAGITEITQIDFNFSFGHDFCVMNANEIRELDKWFSEEYKSNKFLSKIPACFNRDYFGYLYSNAFYLSPDRIPFVEDIRFVFWFDN